MKVKFYHGNTEKWRLYLQMNETPTITKFFDWLAEHSDPENVARLRDEWTSVPMRYNFAVAARDPSEWPQLIDEYDERVGLIAEGREATVEDMITAWDSTFEEIKACTKYFGTRIQQIWPGQEYNMAFYLAMHKEAAQRGGKFDVSMLDTIPIMSKWCTREALTYLFKEVNVERGK